MNIRLVIFLLIIVCSCKVKNVVLKNECKEKSVLYQKVDIDTLLNEPDAYDGKNVEIEGIYFFGFEESSLVKNVAYEYHDCVYVSTIYDDKLNKKIDNLERGVRIRLKGEIDYQLQGHLNSCKLGIKNICYFSVIN